MAFDISSLNSSTDGKTNGNGMPSIPIQIGRVVEVQVDEETFSSVGRIEVDINLTLESVEDNEHTRVDAYPLDVYNITLPMVGECVIVVQDDEGKFYYGNVIPSSLIDQSHSDKLAEEYEQSTPEEENIIINNHEDTNFSVTDDNGTISYGTNVTLELLEATAETAILRRLHEGDVLHQGRWGQSLRFTYRNELNETPWSLDGEDGQPVIALTLGPGQLESPTDDFGFLYMLSDQSIDLGDIEFSPETANLTDPMDAYIGSQVIIGSDRLTFISKTDDISLSSKGLIGLATAKWAVDLDVLMDQVKALSEQVEALCKGEATFTRTAFITIDDIDLIFNIYSSEEDAINNVNKLFISLYK